MPTYFPRDLGRCRLYKKGKSFKLRWILPRQITDCSKHTGILIAPELLQVRSIMYLDYPTHLKYECPQGGKVRRYAYFKGMLPVDTENGTVPFKNLYKNIVILTTLR